MPCLSIVSSLAYRPPAIFSSGEQLAVFLHQSLEEGILVQVFVIHARHQPFCRQKIFQPKSQLTKWKVESGPCATDPCMAYHLLFPGQGSQYVGMCRKVVSLHGVRELFARASEVLKYDLLKLCLEGPKCRLDDTVHCQPAVVVASLAAVEQLRVEKPEV